MVSGTTPSAVEASATDTRPVSRAVSISHLCLSAGYTGSPWEYHSPQLRIAKGLVGAWCERLCDGVSITRTRLGAVPG